ncbi:L-histidine N(alpha)-methyltransferase [bacterium]|nr:L-histidine N(alpha)-methyltransferase [bacterium]
MRNQRIRRGEHNKKLLKKNSVLTYLKSDDAKTVNDEFLNDVIVGLAQSPKRLPCKYFYDEHGSKLFDQICELPEYYLTRTEQAIMNDNASEMAEQLGESVMLVEFGSGSSQKSRVLIENLISPAAYVPIDISREHLLKTANELRERYSDLEIIPIVADFTEPFSLPKSKVEASHAAVYFPGSTIGNFTPKGAEKLLESIASILGKEGGLLIGIDLQKESSIIHAAYNDSAQVTDEFNLNLLRRANRELDADFDMDSFSHKAVYNSDDGRVEISIVSEVEQAVSIAEETFDFEEGEEIHTEYSHKYTVEGFAKMAGRSGFTLHKSWTDEKEMFAVLHLVLDE